MTAILHHFLTTPLEVSHMTAFSLTPQLSTLPSFVSSPKEAASPPSSTPHLAATFAAGRQAAYFCYHPSSSKINILISCWWQKMVSPVPTVNCCVLSPHIADVVRMLCADSDVYNKSPFPLSFVSFSRLSSSSLISYDFLAVWVYIMFLGGK